MGRPGVDCVPRLRFENHRAAARSSRAARILPLGLAYSSMPAGTSLSNRCSRTSGVRPIMSRTDELNDPRRVKPVERMNNHEI